jgi:5'-methylthioadenosine/S-adenosylhomocysteine nucleosidase
MDEEIEEYLKHATEIKKNSIGPIIFHECKLLDKEVVIVKSGIGKVFAAMTTQSLIDNYNPKVILFGGVAGGLNDSLNIGDVVIGIDSMQHDFDARALGFEIGHIAYTNHKIFKAEEKLIELAAEAKLENNKVLLGRVLTGDQFITTSDITKRKQMVEDLKGDCAEMEGAAVAQVCIVNEVAHLIVRTISDGADGDSAKNFQEFLKIVAGNSYKILSHIIKNYD